jgi:maltooligosyltrehalose trehalohydrolase
VSVIERTGAWVEAGGVTFRVWAPDHKDVRYIVYSTDAETPLGELVATTTDGQYFRARATHRGVGLLYKIMVDGHGPFPDPASRSQPHGVHGPSEVVDPTFAWTDAGWGGVELSALIIEEIHVGAATAVGTFDALVGRLDALVELGVTAIELMPIASFPGRRNWGYDGVSLYAPQASYGGPAGLCRLVDAAHARRLAVLLDVVYNHLGPAGNYLRFFANAYFTKHHVTPWGDALAFDGGGAEHVREHFLANAEMWIRDYHLDGLRLDASDVIVDDSPIHILREIGERARGAAPERRVLVIAEDDRNDARLVRPVDQGGYGLDAVWADDFHHSVRRWAAGDHDGYYRDYAGTSEEVAAALERGWLYEGAWSLHRGAPRGTPAAGIAPARFVHCLQNHDQVGNRAQGGRLGREVSPSVYRALAALLLLSPCTPLLFMGQEWNASTPFLYFTDHEPELGRQVTEGRRREFEAFSAFSGHAVPDPQADGTFRRSVLDWSERERPENAGVLAWYRELILLRRGHPALRASERASFSARALGDRAILLSRFAPGAELCLVVVLDGSLDTDLGGAEPWDILLWSEEARFGGNDVGVPVVVDGRVRIPGPGGLVSVRRSRRP